MNRPKSREIELKFRLSAAEGLDRRLEALGFVQVQEERAESSVLWDKGKKLARQGCTLRLRQSGDRTTLTWKGPREADPLLKIRPERETRVEDPQAMEAILEALGFLPILHMEKRRAIWHRGDLEACVDTASFGRFLELEGPREAISQAMADLGLDLGQVERRSYASLSRRAQGGNPEGGPPPGTVGPVQPF